MTGNFTLNLQPVAGFSDGDAFSRYDMSANAYALIGSPAAIQGSGGDQYYLSDRSQKLEVLGPCFA